MQDEPTSIAELKKSYKTKYENAQTKADEALSNVNKLANAPSLAQQRERERYQDEYQRWMDEYYTYKNRYNSLG